MTQHSMIHTALMGWEVLSGPGPGTHAPAAAIVRMCQPGLLSPPTTTTTTVVIGENAPGTTFTHHQLCLHGLGCCRGCPLVKPRYNQLLKPSFILPGLTHEALHRFGDGHCQDELYYPLAIAPG